MPSPDFYRLIPDLQEWGDLNGHPFTPDAWLCGVGNFELAIAYTTLFWPNFVEFDGCIFVGERPEEGNYKSWLTGTEGEKDKVEAVLNHIHLVDLFATSKPTVDQLEYLGQKVQTMWQTKANAELPDRDIVVEFYRGTEEDLSGYQITPPQRPEFRT